MTAVAIARKASCGIYVIVSYEMKCVCQQCGILLQIHDHASERTAQTYKSCLQFITNINFNLKSLIPEGFIYETLVRFHTQPIKNT